MHPHYHPERADFAIADLSPATDYAYGGFVLADHEDKAGCAGAPLPS